MAFVTLPSGFSGAEDLLDTGGAAEYLCVDRTLVVQLIHGQRLPAIRLGQRWIVHRTDLDAWARANPGDRRRGAKAQKTTASQLQVLTLIAECPGITVVAVARRAGLTRRTALGRLQHLEQQGLITRVRGRQEEPYRCYVTEAGRERCRAELATAKPA